MLYEILPDPRVFGAARGQRDPLVLNIHRPLPDSVPVGHFAATGEVVDERISRAEYLDRVQQACAVLGEALEVRFYAHGDETFDASVLDQLSEVRTLAIDGVSHLANEDAVGRMPKLASLRLGVLRLGHPGVLAKMGVARLESFTLASTPTPSIDLSPIADAASLRTLRILGRGANTESIGKASALREFAIVPSPKVSLGFVNALRGLEVLKLVLGKTQTLGDIGSMPALRDLSVFEVHSLEELGDLQRFPRLRRFQVSDQKRITELRVGPANTELEHLRLYSTPALERIVGLSSLPALKSLWAYDSRLAPAWTDLPATLTHFQLVTKAMKGRREHDAEVRAQGLVPEVHPDSHFFYK